MTIDELLALHDRLCSEAKQIMQKKNHDYTSGSADPFANFRTSTAIGVHPAIALLVRVIDKLKRIQTFAERGELHVDGEGLDDACIDVINYMVLLRGLLSEQEPQVNASFGKWLDRHTVAEFRQVNVVDTEEIANED